MDGCRLQHDGGAAMANGAASRVFGESFSTVAEAAFMSSGQFRSYHAPSTAQPQQLQNGDPTSVMVRECSCNSMGISTWGARGVVALSDRPLTMICPIVQEHSGGERSSSAAPAVSPSDARLPGTAISSPTANGAAAALVSSPEAAMPAVRDHAGDILQLQPGLAVASGPDGSGRSHTASMAEGTADGGTAESGDASEAIVLATSHSGALSSAAGSAEGNAHDSFAEAAADVPMTGDGAESEQPPAKRAAVGSDQPMTDSNNQSDPDNEPMSNN